MTALTTTTSLATMTASIVSPQPIETVEWLREQADLADAQSTSAVQAVQSFAHQIRNHKTPENLAKFRALAFESDVALAQGREWHKKLWSAQLAAHKSKSNPSLTLSQPPPQSIQKADS